MTSRSYVILAVLFGTLGVAQCIRWNSSGTITPGCLLNFLPGTAFLVAYILSGKFRRRLFHVVAIPLCLLTVGIWGFVAMGVEMVIDATAEVTDVRRYGEILDSYWNSSRDLVSHFPRPIPAEASDVRFSFRPAFFQGAAHIQLRYSLPSEEIAELHACFAERKTRSFFGGDTNDHMNMKEGMPTSFFYTADTEDRKFPIDYEIMIFDEVLKEEDRPPGFYWNHGRSHGVAISRKRSEIVYWAESW